MLEKKTILKFLSGLLFISIKEFVFYDKISRAIINAAENTNKGH